MGFLFEKFGEYQPRISVFSSPFVSTAFLKKEFSKITIPFSP
jgi:hypothetical protein